MKSAVDKTVQGLNLLVVDSDARTADLVKKAAAHGREARPTVRSAESADAAEVELRRVKPDVVFLNVQLNDHAGADLISNLKRRFPTTDIIALSRSKGSDQCLEAFRAGAADMLVAPFNAQDVQRAIARARERRTASERTLHRHQRLRTVCRRLNKARHEISQQVDLLCNDLVRAYQEMAQQLNLTQTAAEFAQSLSSEIDIEGVLRRTMEWILRKLGPINAAIYLPTHESGNTGGEVELDYFALGAYLNLDTQADALLIEALGKTVVQQARGAAAVSIDTDHMLDELFGDDARALKGRKWLAMGCHTPRDCLAVLVIFHGGKNGEGADVTSGSGRSLIEAIAPVLADRIEQALGLYQRLHRFDEDEEQGSDA